MNQKDNSSPMTKAKIALITGGTSGIGLALAREFAVHGYDLVITSRNMNRLDMIAKQLTDEFQIQVTPIENNLSDHDAPQQLYDKTKNASLEIDALVNNAGFGTQGAFAETDLASELDMIQVNVSALTALTKLFLRDMLQRGSGKIMNIASTAGFQPCPFFAVYFASKAYVLHFTEAIAKELRGRGVTVTALCPGPTETSFAKRAGIEGEGFFREGSVMNVNAVARIGFRGFMRGKTIVVPGWKNKLLIFLVRFTPRWLVLKAVRYI